MAGDTRRRYPAELKSRAVRMVAERPEGESEWSAMSRIAALLGVATGETVRNWVRRSQADHGVGEGVTSQESAELKRLRRENAELRRANAILKSASAFFRGRTRPAARVITEFVRSHAECCEGGLRWGVEPICAVLTEHGLPVAPSTYYRQVNRPATGHDRRDAVLINHIHRVHAANYGVYGARKVWLALNREGAAVARCTVERLMREVGLSGAVRGKIKRTTHADRGAPRPADLVSRQFAPPAPDLLWVNDITYVSTWSGWAYTAFVTDAYARRILGWAVASSMNTELVLAALEQAVWTRQRHGRVLGDLVCHSDAGSQYVSIRYSERLAEANIAGSVGAVGDSYDNALAETINGLYKTELIKPRRPWKTIDQVEIATAEWVDWFNHRRLYEYCGDIPPAELEDAYYARFTARQPAGQTV
ncbi:IS3 family transposase [Mycobacteroides abscessus]|nr:IS3 family transposase [Mycobacteroides abscessus]MDM3948254.1 IS3 family transposase [Mycobacteroides abscessus]